MVPTLLAVCAARYMSANARPRMSSGVVSMIVARLLRRDGVRRAEQRDHQDTEPE